MKPQKANATWELPPPEEWPPGEEEKRKKEKEREEEQLFLLQYGGQEETLPFLKSRPQGLLFPFWSGIRESPGHPTGRGVG